MFPKSVSGTSGKLRENKGDDMAEGGVNDAMLREKLKDVVCRVKNGVGLSVTADPALGQSIIWASERIAKLESQTQSPERSGDEPRDAFFSLGYGVETDFTQYCAAVAWGHDYIRRLERERDERDERDKRDAQQLLDQNSELRRENERLELENENLSKTILTLSKSPQLASPDSDEEIHQLRRRERLLDEITLSCVRGFLHSDAEDKTHRQIGVSARDRAEYICHGIKEFDAE